MRALVRRGEVETRLREVPAPLPARAVEGRMHVRHDARLLAAEDGRALIHMAGAEPVWVSVGQPIVIDLYVDVR